MCLSLYTEFSMGFSPFPYHRSIIGQGGREAVPMNFSCCVVVMSGLPIKHAASVGPSTTGAFARESSKLPVDPFLPSTVLKTIDNRGHSKLYLSAPCIVGCATFAATIVFMASSKWRNGQKITLNTSGSHTSQSLGSHDPDRYFVSALPVAPVV